MIRAWQLSLVVLCIGFFGCQQAPDRPDKPPIEKVESYPPTLDENVARQVIETGKAPNSPQEPGEPKAEEVPTPIVDPSILDPKGLDAPCPSRYLVTVYTTKGRFRLAVDRVNAPLAADRFYHLVKLGYFTNVPLYRVIAKEFVQFGLHSDPRVNRVWQRLKMHDETAKLSNRVGTIGFVSSGPGTRTTQVLINLTDQPRFDRNGIVPFGEVIEGLAIVNSFFSDYGDAAPRGRGPRQVDLYQNGHRGLRKSHPNLDYVLSAWVHESE